MRNIITHKYLRDNELENKAVLAGNTSNVVDIYYDCSPDSSDAFNIVFLNGTSEVFVGDIITTSGGATARVAAVNHTSGTWAGGDEIGSLDIINLSKFIAVAESCTSDNGGAISSLTFLSITSFRDTSLTDCSIPSVTLDDYVQGEYIQPDAVALTPTNPIPWSEGSIAEHFDVLFLVISKSNSSSWIAHYGDNASVIGYIKIEAALDRVSLMDTSGAAIQLNLPSGSIPHDGESHSIAVILRRDIGSATMTCEIDGIAVGKPVAISDTEHVQLTAENEITFTNCNLQGVLSCRFKNGLPVNYREAITEMKDKWSLGGRGISAKLIGIR